MKLVTYATHSEGLFDNLMNSGYPIEVIGWGTKWSGFMDKIKGILEYLYQQSDEDIIVFLDGFDTIINKNLDNMESVFKKMNCPILLSQDTAGGWSNVLPTVITDYFRSKVFGTCKNGEIANAGLYMGYCKELQIFLRRILSTGLDDDQRAMNSLCSEFPSIKIDTDNVIFENCSSSSEISGAYIVGLPGGVSFDRVIKRGIKEYCKYFIPEIVIFCVLCILFVVYKYR